MRRWELTVRATGVDILYLARYGTASAVEMKRDSPRVSLSCFGRFGEETGSQASSINYCTTLVDLYGTQLASLPVRYLVLRRETKGELVPPGQVETLQTHSRVSTDVTYHLI